jgi:hypothetical protein
MGRMLNNLRSVTTVPNDLESILRDALSKRNFLAHGFFRHHAENLFSAAGRDKMLPELDECRNLFQEADSRLDALVSPLRREAGITDEWLERELKRRSQGEGA